MEMPISPYIHLLDGRLRIKIPEVKGMPQQAVMVEQVLLGMDGITDVTANPTTGNVLVLFDASVIGQQDILTALQKAGYLKESHHASRQERKGLTHFVVQSAIELALERLVLALI